MICHGRRVNISCYRVYCALRDASEPLRAIDIANEIQMHPDGVRKTIATLIRLGAIAECGYQNGHRQYSIAPDSPELLPDCSTLRRDRISLIVRLYLTAHPQGCTSRELAYAINLEPRNLSHIILSDMQDFVEFRREDARISRVRLIDTPMQEATA